MAKCGKQCEVYSRIVGYFRPVADWNKGKKDEFNERKKYKVQTPSGMTAGHENEFQERNVYHNYRPGNNG